MSSSPDVAPANNRTPFLTKGRSVLLLVLVSLAALICATQTWVRVDLPDSGVTQALLTVSGTDASKPVPALVLVAAAASVAAAVSGRVRRQVALAVVALALAGASAASVVVVADPHAAAAAKIAEKIGLSGHASGSVSTATAWPIVTAVIAALGAVLAAVIFVTSRSWAETAKYRAPAGASDDDADAAHRRAKDAAKGRTSIPTRQAQSIDDWDDLTRGDDPTA